MYNLLNPERHSTTDLLYLKEKEKKKVLEKKPQGRKLLWVDGIDEHLYGLKMETQTECLLVGH